jgi:hypothetical protein
VDAQFSAGEWGLWHVLFRESPGTIETPVNTNCGVAFMPDGMLNLYKGVGDVHAELLERRVRASMFKQGFEANRLTIIAQEQQIAIYVNGEPFWFFIDESSSKGTISLAVENRTDGTILRVHFDNLKIWDISDLARLRLLARPRPLQCGGRSRQSLL